MALVIKKYIEQIIKKQVEEHGIVVWYDPDGCYATMIKEINWDKMPVIHFEGSYYDVRFKAEQYFEGIDRHKVLIYLDTKRDTGHFPLIELEQGGCIVEPRGPVEKNTDLHVVVKEAFSGKISEELIIDICKKIEAKTITIDEIEKITENAKSINTASLSIIFNTNDPQSIILNFLTNPDLDKLIQKKKIEEELIKLIKIYLGIDTKGSSLQRIREITIETVLITDFTESLKGSEFKDKYMNLNLPKEPNYVSSIKAIVELWRQRSDITEEYVRKAEEIQNTYSLESETFNYKDIIDVQTFSVVDRMLIDTCLSDPDTANITEHQDIVVRRKNGFWANKKAEHSLIWVLIEYCINLRLAIQNALDDIKQKEFSVSDLLNHYIGSNRNGWFLVDKYYRLLESKDAEFDIGSVFGDKLERFISKVRDEYSQFLNTQTEKVSLSLLGSKAVGLKDTVRQKDILTKSVLPLLQNKKKCAYFLVDALRYEMGEELYESIENCEGKNISPVLASIPTITPFGMLALILNSNEDVDVKSANGRVVIEVKGSKVNNRNERLKFLEHKIPFSIEVFKLEEIIKPKPSIRNKAKEADLLIITSQEIDSLCESGESLLAHQVMNHIILSLKRAIYSLAELGFEEFVLSADHGYLLGNEIGKELKIDIPNGETCSLHKRVWLGKGGNDPENTVRFKASDLGYISELDFVFPRSLAIFKTPGSENDYFHGGLSLQEMVIPLINVQMKPSPKYKKTVKDKFVINLSKDTITNRIFTVTVQYKVEELVFTEMLQEKKKVRLNVLKDKEQIGRAVASEYGFDEATDEIVLERNRKNVITIILDDNHIDGNLSIILVDSRTELELEKKTDIPLKILI